jgi:hypothetical protein
MVGTWTTLNAPPGVSADTMLLLTDGSVLVHNATGPAGPGTGGKDWRRLTPDAKGRYVNGTWSAAFNMSTARQFFASGVLNDGRVFVVGGEFSDAFAQDECYTAEIFEPLTGQWAPLPKPSPDFDVIKGDVVSCILADGRVLCGSLVDSRTAIWNPADGTWTEAGKGFSPTGAQTKIGTTNEETWTLLANGNVLTVQISGATATQNAEMYVPSIDGWVSAGVTTRNIVANDIEKINPEEIGPALLLPDGRVLAIGGNGHTEFYSPNADPALPGTWVAGPDFPADPENAAAPAGLLTCLDGAGILLPGGHVLCLAGTTRPEPDERGNPSYWSGPTTVCVIDPSATPPTLLPLPTQPPNIPTQPDDLASDTWTGTFLMLPNGHPLFSNQSAVLSEYVPDPAELSPKAEWRPTITACPDTLNVGQTYTVSGTQFNGLSHASSYGDDRQNATNYPLIRISNTTDDVVYLRTFGFSTRAVATGRRVVSTNVQVPSHTPAGSWQLVVVVNGCASDPRTVIITATAIS